MLGEADASELNAEAIKAAEALRECRKLLSGAQGSTSKTGKERK